MPQLGPESHTEYEQALKVRRILRRYEHACRRAGQTTNILLDPERRGAVQGKMNHPCERDAVLLADMDRFLARLRAFDRKVLALVALRGWSETVAAKRLHSSQPQVSRAYWRAIVTLYRLLVAAGYVQPVGGNDETEKAGAEPSLAEVESGLAADNR